MASLLDTYLDERAAKKGTALVQYYEALRRWKIWRDTVPYFYTTCVHARVHMASLSVQLFPYLIRDPHAPGLLRHAVLYGYQDPDGDGAIVLASVAMDEPDEHEQLPAHISSSAAASSPILEEARWRHTSDPDRLRYCPALPKLMAVKCSGTSLSLYDIGTAAKEMEAAQQRRREAAEAVEGEAGQGGRRQGGNSGGGGTTEELPSPKSVLQSESQDGVALAWGWGSAGGGGGTTAMRLFSGVMRGGVAEYAVREDGTLSEVSVRQGGHDVEADVMDLAWGPDGGGRPEGTATDQAIAPAAAASLVSGVSCPLLASAATDGRTLLWDPRQRRPALAAPRCQRDVNAVALAPGGVGDSAGYTQLAAAGDDGIIRVYDVRQLGNGSGGSGISTAEAAGVPAALHRLKAHGCTIRQLSYSPHVPSLLASADEQGRILLWDLDRTTPLQEGLTSRPQLVFVHAGHVLPVDDFSWSTELYGTLASVSSNTHDDMVAAVQADPHMQGQELEGQPPAVVVWRPVAEVLPPPPAGVAAGAGRTAQRARK